MKKYNKPEMDIILFGNEDVIVTSGKDEMSARMLKTDVNGKEGTDYGSNVSSIFK